MDGLTRDDARGRPGAPVAPTQPPGPAVWEDAIHAESLLLHTRALDADPHVRRDLRLLTAALRQRHRGAHVRFHEINRRIKEFGVLQGKIADDCTIKNLLPHESAAQIADALRYTIVVDHTTFTDSVRFVLDTLATWGYTVREDRIRNAFVEGNRYKGLHAIVETGGDAAVPGLLFEIQFHTEASIAIKARTHELFERCRDRSLPLRSRLAAYRKIVRESDLILDPAGVEQFTNLKVYRPPEP